MIDRRVLLDTAVLVAAERNERRAFMLKNRASQRGTPLLVPTVVLAETWRDHRTSANLGRFLRGCSYLSEIRPSIARRAGELRRAVPDASTIDALVVALAEPDGRVITADTTDLEALAGHTRNVDIRPF